MKKKMTLLFVCLFLAISMAMPAAAAGKAAASGSVPKGMAAPTITAVYNCSKGADIRWKKVTGASGYVVYRFSAKTGHKKVATIKDPGKLQCYDTGVKDNCWGKVFHYYIKALYGKKLGPASQRAVLQRLAPVRITSWKLSGTSVTLQWERTVSTSKANGYEIQYASSAADLQSRKGSFKSVTVLGTNTMKKAVTGLKRNKTYYFRVRGYVKYRHSGTGKEYKSWSAYSNVVSRRIPVLVKYRALTVGNGDYRGFEYDLSGPYNDIRAIGESLKKYGYGVTSKRDLSASGIISSIRSAFRDATVNDVSLFFYSGHGDTYTGALIGVDEREVSMKTLATELAKVPGKVVVFLDSCGSGSGLSRVGGAGDPARYVIQAFSDADPGLPVSQEEGEPSRTGSGELRNSKFLVMTSTGDQMTSSDIYYRGGWGGVFTRSLVSSMGCTFPGGGFTGSIPADGNGDRKLTLTELYYTARQKVRFYDPFMTVSIYPAGSQAVIMIKK